MSCFCFVRGLVITLGHLLCILTTIEVDSLPYCQTAQIPTWFQTLVSRIQISNTLVGYCWRVVKPFIAVLVLYSSGCSSAMGSTSYWMGADVHGPHYGWSMRQALAMLLVPDIPLTDKKKNSKKCLYLNFTLALLALHFNT